MPRVKVVVTGCATAVATAGRRGPVTGPPRTTVVVTGDLAATSGGGGLLESTRCAPEGAAAATVTSATADAERLVA